MNIEQKATKYLNKMFLDEDFRNEVCKSSDLRIFAYIYSGVAYDNLLLTLVDPAYAVVESTWSYHSRSFSKSQWHRCFYPGDGYVIALSDEKTLQNIINESIKKISEYQELDKNVVFKSLSLLNFI